MAKKPKFTRVPPEVSVSSLSPLDIGCGSSKCIDDYHCFRMSKRDIARYEKAGVCKDCGEDKVDWKRIKKRDVRDVDFMIESLQNELIRYVYWNNPVEPRAIKYAIERGIQSVRDKATDVLRRSVGSAATAWDGRQTKKTGKEIVWHAQHATATCCRRCLEYWHGIPKDQVLAENELEYCTTLVMEYVKRRVPEIDVEEDENN